MAQGLWQWQGYYNTEDYERYEGGYSQDYSDSCQQEDAFDHAESKPGWAPSNQERYERFYTTLLHGSDWSTGLKYFALYWLSFRDQERRLPSPMFENDAEKHAEEHLLDHLRLLLSVIDKDKLVSLTILQNSSPCARCAELYTNDELLTELAGHPDVNVELVFSSIHRVRRPSCRWKHHGHVDDIDVDEHKDNLDGLKTLSLAGFQLRATNDGDWAELRSALQLPNTSYQGDYDQGTSSRHEEDCTLEEDLEYLRENIF